MSLAPRASVAYCEHVTTRSSWRDVEYVRLCDEFSALREEFDRLHAGRHNGPAHRAFLAHLHGFQVALTRWRVTHMSSLPAGIPGRRIR